MMLPALALALAVSAGAIQSFLDNPYPFRSREDWWNVVPTHAPGYVSVPPTTPAPRPALPPLPPAPAPGTEGFFRVDGQGEIARLTGHTATVHTAAFSPDAKRVLTASHDGTARLWDWRAGREVQRFHHPPEIRAAALSPNGRRVVTAGADRAARLWDADTGRELATLEGHADMVGAAAFSPDGRLVVTGSRDGTVRLWDSETGQPAGAAAGSGQGEMLSVAFGPGGSTLLLGQSDGTATLWDIAAATAVLRLNGWGSLVSVAFSPDGTLALTCAENGYARLWNLPSGERKGMLGYRSCPASFSLDGAAVVGGAPSGSVDIWDARTLRTLEKIQTKLPLRSARLSPDGSKLLLAADTVAIVWNLKPGPSPEQREAMRRQLEQPVAPAKPQPGSRSTRDRFRRPLLP